MKDHRRRPLPASGWWNLPRWRQHPSAPVCWETPGPTLVKVEPPGGDRFRSHGPFPDPSTGSGQALDPNWSGMFLYLNANKRGMELDLLHQSHKALFDELVAAADILIVGGQSADIKRQGLRREVSDGI